MKLDFSELDRAFNPRCVAVIGDKDPFLWVRAQLQFKGKLYSVQISPNSIKGIEAMGVKNYTSLLDIPEQVDLAIVSVPRKIAPQILEDCIRKKVAGVHFFTSGFAETDTEEGRKFTEQIAERARAANLYVIGPNCMGIFNPKVGIKQNELQYSNTSGPVGFISQSGTHAVTFSREGHYQGLDIDKSVSFGNGIVLDSPDYLEYFGQDPAIKIIGMYLEGVKDGRRFMSVLRSVTARKPVVIWKGGRTRESARATASHTGSLAVSHGVWQAAVKQCGGMNVEGMEELIDTIKALLYLPPVKGNRSAVLGGSGGLSVAISDAFAEAGMQVPPLTQKSYDQLASFFTLVGGTYRNPVDMGPQNRKEEKRILEIITADNNIDNIVMIVAFKTMSGRRSMDEILADMELAIDTQRKTTKPVMVVNPYYSFSAEEVEESDETTRMATEAGVPVFTTIERGARALRNAFQYYSRKNGVSG